MYQHPILLYHHFLCIYTERFCRFNRLLKAIGEGIIAHVILKSKIKESILWKPIRFIKFNNFSTPTNHDCNDRCVQVLENWKFTSPFSLQCGNICYSDLEHYAVDTFVRTVGQGTRVTP